MNDSQALARCISCLLANATADATWGDFQTEWNPIITALTCKLLLACGLEIDAPWFISRSTFHECNITASLRWLNNSIRPDGTFGTDFWDAAQLGIVIERFSLMGHFTAYGSLSKYLLEAIHKRTFMDDDSQWQGPGFMAAAIEYCRSLGRFRDVHNLSKELLALRTSSGYWQGYLDPEGTPIVSPVWHTSQCMIALSADARAYSQEIERAADWLRRTQDKSGAWISVQQYKIYFTAYAIHALLVDSAHSSSPHIRNATDYLKSQMSAEGKCSDLGGTLMCGSALQAVVNGNFERDITLADYVLCQLNLKRAEALRAHLKDNEMVIAGLQSEVARFEKKFGDAEIAITKKQLLFITLLGLFLTALGTVAGVYALGPLFHPPTQGGAINPTMPHQISVPSADPGAIRAPEQSPKVKVAPAERRSLPKQKPAVTRKEIVN